MQSDMNQKLLLAEKFFSVQGEYPRVGYPCVFYRFYKCNFKCPFCDTMKDGFLPYTSYSIKELVKEYEEKYKGIGITFTGGEPGLFASSIYNFLKAIPIIIPYVIIETNGTFLKQENINMLYSCSHLEKFFITVSPKYYMYKDNLEKYFESEYYKNILEFFKIEKAVYLKLVVDPQYPLEFFRKIVEDFIHASPFENWRISLMPLTGNDELHEQSVAYIKELILTYYIGFSPRIHLTYRFR